MSTRDFLKETITYLKRKRVDYGDFRQVYTSHQGVMVKNGTVENLLENSSQGFGVRVLVNGSWGFAASSILTEAEMKRIADEAVEIARASAQVNKQKVRLAEVEPYKDTYKTRIGIDPFQVSLDDKINLLLQADEILRKDPRIKVAQGNMSFNRIDKIFASTEGAWIEQTIWESGGGISAVAVEGSEVQCRSYPQSYHGDFATRGYEFILEMNLVSEAERVRAEALALLHAPECPSGEKTLILEGSQVAIQVHESCGHPIELDRVLGTEISLAGGSFLTLDKLGKFRYGSQAVHITADATLDGGLGSFGYDDEGAKAQRTDIIRNGLFVGYLTSRETAVVLGQQSNGTMRADGWNRIPLIRMVNISLEPGEPGFDELVADTQDGLYLSTLKSWSIDDLRLNFQFGCEMAQEIKHGKLGRIFKNPVYTGITPQFWNSCDAVCNKDFWHIWGTPNCGKGDPMQAGHVGHGTAPTRFHRVQVGVKK
jgi:TldD protein